MLQSWAHFQERQSLFLPERSGENGGEELGPCCGGLAGRVQGVVLRPRLPLSLEKPGCRRPDSANPTAKEASVQKFPVVPGERLPGPGSSPG